jgi:hypothetical protein
MSLIDMKQKAVAVIGAAKMRIAVLSVMLTGLVGLASAATINDSVGPILQGVAELFVPLLAMIVGAVPLIVTLAIVSFILGILAMILRKIA